MNHALHCDDSTLFSVQQLWDKNPFEQRHDPKFKLREPPVEVEIAPTRSCSYWKAH